MKNIPLYCGLLLISLCCVYPTYGFVPNFLFNIILELSFNPDSVNHVQITERAILQVVKDLLVDNPNSDTNIDSTLLINSIPFLTAESLIKAYYGVASDDLADRFRNAIEDITRANTKVDLGKEMKVAAAHFDSEKIQAGHNRLVELKQIVITGIKLGNYEFARSQTGRMLHTLQDFYSHSNWVEMGKTTPFTVLGQNDKNPENVAAKITRTCTNCEKNLLIYQCTNNIVVDQLTTGYYGGDIDETGNVIEKPEGKCSHGGILDTTRDMDATGGINKDSLAAIISPHADLHSEAASLATMASEIILNEIRVAVNDDSKFASFLNIDFVKHQISSIAYVIDTT